jgi:undecaprenyl pyrophosphate synthase
MTLHSAPESEWVPDKSLIWLHKFVFTILKRGSLPKHIAIVMDGNRRFAKKKGVEKNVGHEKG